MLKPSPDRDDSDRGNFHRAAQFNQPLPATVRWLEQLPREIQPLALLREFPRIANFMARSWSEQSSIKKYLDSLLIDDRKNRQGFPPEVHVELLNLKDYVDGRYSDSLHPR